MVNFKLNFACPFIILVYLNEFCNLGSILIYILIVLPQIVPFNFGQEQIYLDESVTATCSIIKGDLPLTVWWTLANSFSNTEYNLTSNDGVMITRNSKKVSLLTIESVKARHMGNYTCYAQNKAGLTQYNANLLINGEF